MENPPSPRTCRPAAAQPPAETSEEWPASLAQTHALGCAKCHADICTNCVPCLCATLPMPHAYTSKFLTDLLHYPATPGLLLIMLCHIFQRQCSSALYRVPFHGIALQHGYTGTTAIVIHSNYIPQIYPSQLGCSCSPKMYCIRLLVWILWCSSRTGDMGLETLQGHLRWSGGIRWLQCLMKNIMAWQRKWPPLELLLFI
jgi:hypothetical protein